MDITLKRQADRAIADLVEHGGGTYEPRTLLPFEPTDGYAVGVGGVTIPEAGCTSDVLAWAARAVAGEYITSYVGTWLNDGVVYIDAVRYVKDLNRAFVIGQGASQRAVYGFAEKEAIEVPS